MTTTATLDEIMAWPVIRIMDVRPGAAVGAELYRFDRIGRGWYYEGPLEHAPTSMWNTPQRSDAGWYARASDDFVRERVAQALMTSVPVFVSDEHRGWSVIDLAGTS